MKLFILLFTCLILAACSSKEIYNNHNFDTFEEVMSFYDVSDTDTDVITAFILKTKNEHDSAHFSLYYNQEQQPFIDLLKKSLKQSKISSSDYSFFPFKGDRDYATVVTSKVNKVTNFSESVLKIKVVAKYVKLRNVDCGVLTHKSADKYDFGCSLNYNRNISLANPKTSID